jgi:phage recombination protein Bet
MPESTTLAVRAVTADELDLVKKTVANGATSEELKLYLYDCARQGVHPLDRLIHFTKRAGKYTPITSIDFMRIRAADTGEYAGSDDAKFTGSTETTDRCFEASVTVWRLVQGTRCGFTATARWSEYKPEQNDFMWKKMPHTMLAKCAEALALRKGFPRQLAGLYAKEEMDQAGQDAQVPPETVHTPRPAPISEPARELTVAAGVSSMASTTVKDVTPKEGEKGGKPWILYLVTFNDGRSGATFDAKLALQAEHDRDNHTRVMPVLEESAKKPGNFLLKGIDEDAIPFSQNQEGDYA